MGRVGWWRPYIEAPREQKMDEEREWDTRRGLCGRPDRGEGRRHKFGREKGGVMPGNRGARRGQYVRWVCVQQSGVHTKGLTGTGGETVSKTTQRGNAKTRKKEIRSRNATYKGEKRASSLGIKTGYVMEFKEWECTGEQNYCKKGSDRKRR